MQYSMFIKFLPRLNFPALERQEAIFNLLTITEGRTISIERSKRDAKMSLITFAYVILHIDIRDISVD